MNDKRAKREAHRVELYERIGSGDITLPDAIRLMRKITGRTQADYARAVGISPRILIEIERGTGNPTLKTLAKILAPFGLEMGLRLRRRDDV